MKKIFFIGISLCLSVPAAHAQTDSLGIHDAGVPAWHDMLTRVPGDWGRFAGTSFTKEALPALAGLAGITCALVAVDHETWRSTDRLGNSSGFTRDATQLFVGLGDGRFVLALAAGLGIAGWTTDDHRALRTASQIVESYLSCGIAVQILKHVAGRERPDRQTRPGGNWRPFPDPSEYHRSMPRFDAFPSGHTAATMAMVTVLIENYPDEKWLKPAGYCVVGLVGVGLVAKGWHWYSDLPLAIALGYQFGKIAARPGAFDVISNDMHDGLNLTVAPSINAGGTGVTAALTF